MIFQYFSRQTLFSRTFQESLLNSSTFQACANPVDAGPSHHLYLNFVLVNSEGSSKTAQISDNANI